MNIHMHENSHNRDWISSLVVYSTKDLRHHDIRNDLAVVYLLLRKGQLTNSSIARSVI